MIITPFKVTVDDITITYKPCNRLNPYLQWKHIAMWQFRFNLYLMIREAIQNSRGN